MSFFLFLCRCSALRHCLLAACGTTRQPREFIICHFYCVQPHHPACHECSHSTKQTIRSGDAGKRSADRPGPGAGRGSDRRHAFCLPLCRAAPAARHLSGLLRPGDGRIQPQVFRNNLSTRITPPICGAPFANTMIMGLGAATGGTILGFIFAYALVRCSMPFGRLVHVVTLLPTISPPFAIAIATILLFGRNGLITRQIVWDTLRARQQRHLRVGRLIFVQIITFFPVAYLIIRAMLERIDASMEEAALSLGASKFHIFRTVTLPLLGAGHCRLVLCCSLSSRWPTWATRCCWAATSACFPPKSTWRWPASLISKRRRALVDVADPNADAFSVAALLHRQALLHCRHRQAHDRAHLRQGAGHALDLHHPDAADVDAGAAALFHHPGRIVHQTVGHRQHPATWATMSQPSRAG
jgi:ABC-type glycerol-3-phosphate transport system permease component